MDDFVLRSLLAGLGVALMAAPLGCFVVWRRMAYFGDAIAHTALLGWAIGFLLGLNVTIGIIAVCAVVAIILSTLQRQTRIASDTLLGIMAHTALSLGLILAMLMPQARFDLLGILFGDILAVAVTDLIWIAGGIVVVYLALWRIWRSLLALTVDAELARVEGVPVTATRLSFMLLLAFVVAMAMKVVGVLLITSLLIIPAAAVRRISSTPERMALHAVLTACIAVCIGLWGSFVFDTPSGPSIVLAAAALFALSFGVPGRRPA